MNDDFNPLNVIFPNLNVKKIQDDTIKLFSSIARESERSLNALKECIPTTNQDVTPEQDTSSDTYECPFPKRNEVFPMEDISNFKADTKDTPSNDTSISKEDNTMNSSNNIDPFSSLEETPEVTKSSSTEETPKVEKCTPIDPFSNVEENSQPLTDREVIDKTSSMWKYNPIGDTLENYPEYITETGATPYAKIISSRVRGKKHKHNATNCDDYFKFSLVGNCCVVGVSDGAGSKVYSRIGAKEVTTSYVRAMGSALETLLKEGSFLEGLSYPVTDAMFNKSCSKIAFELQNAVKCAYSSLSCKFDEISKDTRYTEPLGRELSINDLSCTLLSAVIIPIETSNGTETFVATLQIGDGLMCSINSLEPFNTAIKILGTSDSGNFSGETEFITANGMVEQSNLMRRIKVMKSKTSAIILATDGVADDYFPNESKSCNLYNDLILNGVISINVEQDNSIKIVPPIREQKTIEETPKDVCVAYCEDIQEFFNISDETLWNDKTFIQNAVSVYSQCFSNDQSENLESWLDNYTKRGSFDDRTLFLYQPTK